MIDIAVIPVWETRLCGTIILLAATAIAIRFLPALAEGMLSYRFVESTCRAKKNTRRKIEYQFIVDTSTVKGSRIGYLVIAPGLLEKLERVKVGDELELQVFYDPLKPTRCALQRGVSLVSWFWIGVWVLALLLGLVLIVNFGEVNRILYWSSGD